MNIGKKRKNKRGKKKGQGWSIRDIKKTIVALGQIYDICIAEYNYIFDLMTYIVSDILFMATAKIITIRKEKGRLWNV